MPPRSKNEVKEIIIKAPNYKILECVLVGTAPFVSNAFPQEALTEMENGMTQGPQAKSKKERKPRNFEADYKGSMHFSDDGWVGIPAPAFRAALIRACSTSNIEMTKAKQCFFVEADGFDAIYSTPLVRISKGTPALFKAYARNQNGSPDIRSRARFAPGWEVKLRVRYDADIFTDEHVANLILRAGISVGVGAGRPFSTMSAGQGWGTWEIKDAQQATA
jgi:hypothetical protein